MRELVVVGRNARVWRALRGLPALQGVAVRELGHAELDNQRFAAHEEVWVFAYSHDATQNTALLARLQAQGARQLVYLSSSSVVVAAQTDCYAYPRIKRLAEQAALQFPEARVLTLGLVYGDISELPGGCNAATSHEELAQFMAAPQWQPGQRSQALMRTIDRPLSRPGEPALHRLYGALIHAAGRWPCALRPLDVVLRALGMRWYGYTFLANERWTTTMS